MVEKLEAQDDTLEAQGLETARLTMGGFRILVLQRPAGPPLSACINLTRVGLLRYSTQRRSLKPERGHKLQKRLMCDLPTCSNVKPVPVQRFPKWQDMRDRRRGLESRIEVES